MRTIKLKTTVTGNFSVEGVTVYNTNKLEAGSIVEIQSKVSATSGKTYLVAAPPIVDFEVEDDGEIDAIASVDVESYINRFKKPVTPPTKGGKK